MANRRTGPPAAAPHDTDRYPRALQGLRRVVEEANLPEGPIERLEVTFLANGDATYRVWEPRAEESVGGFLAGE